MINETHEEWMNRLATDILDCSECLSEDIEEIGCKAEKGKAPHIYHYKCKQCNHNFDIYE